MGLGAKEQGRQEADKRWSQAVEQGSIPGEQMSEQNKNLLKMILSKGATERLGRVRVVKPELATQLEAYMLQLFQSGKIKGEVSEEQLKTILEAVSSQKEFKILR
ncbi:hypothetical protein EPN87_03415 [archaeon]|nr:MAG: hypothetical protein EPN87_03415 [archaeon]